MKKIRMFGVLCLAVICLTVMSGCGRRDGNGGTDGSDVHNGTDQAGDHVGATRETEWCTCEPGDHENNTDRTENGTHDENGTGGLLDDIGNGITDAVDDLGHAAGDVIDDLGGNGTTEDGTDRGTVGNEENRIR